MAAKTQVRFSFFELAFDVLASSLPLCVSPSYQSINQSMLRNKRKADTRMAHLPPLLRHSKELKFGIGDGNLQYYL